MGGCAGCRMGICYTGEIKRQAKNVKYTTELPVSIPYSDRRYNPSTVKPRRVCEIFSLTSHTVGRSYSGRGKYLQNCNSVVFMSNRTWVEPQHGLLVSSGPHQNFVEIQDDFSDLEEKVLELTADQEKAKRIAKNSVDTFRDRHLTPAAQVCYWRKLIRSWATVSFVPEKYQPGTRKQRGISFETFA